MLNFFKTTVLGGLLFLFPVVILIAIIGKAVALATSLAAPLARALPFVSTESVAVIDLIAFVIVIVVCFLAGLAARTRSARQIVDNLDAKMSSTIPVYQFLKSKLHAIVPADDAAGLKPVLVRFDDLWQIAFEVERIDDKAVTIFLPGSPDPWAGAICFMTADRVRPLDMPMASVVRSLIGLGKGTNEQLRAHF